MLVTSATRNAIGKGEFYLSGVKYLSPDIVKHIEWENDVHPKRQSSGASELNLEGIKMRKKKFLSVLTVLGTVGFITVAQAHSYTIQLYNVDDVMSAYITNSNYTDQLIGQVSFLDNQTFDFSSMVAAGPNTLTVTDYNYYQGWTYGYDFRIDGATYADGSCGTANVYGCDSNAQYPDNAITFSTSIPFTTVPEPASWAMLLAILLGMGAVVRATHRMANKTA